MGNEAAGKLRKPRGDLIADGEIVVAVGHHAKALGGIDQNNIVVNVRAGFRRGGAAYLRGGVNRARAAGALLFRIRRAAGSAEAAAEILQAAASRAGLIDDRFRARGPVRERVIAATHRTCSRNSPQGQKRPPPSPGSSAIDGSPTCGFPALPAICRWF